MDPWIVIGWIVLALLLLIIIPLSIRILYMFYVVIKRFLKYRIRHYRTRNTPFATGQRWQSLDWKGPYEITDIGKFMTGWGVDRQKSDKDRISLRSGNASWSESPEEFRDRIKSQRLYL
jgi:hypothetical protein